MIYRKYVKRFLSIVFAIVLLIITSPITLVTALLIRLKMGSPVLFMQDRVGYQERIFKLMKFRTMTNKKDENGNLLPDKDRKTKLGNILRKTSIDELPSLFNVLKGDMSIIGPRPLLPKYLELYNEEQHKRHNIRPGCTCIASIEGRNSIPWVERLKMDTYYAEHASFPMDVKIAFQTAGVVLMRKGAPDASESSRESIYKALKK